MEFHPDEETLEQYVLGRLSGGELTVLEEHLLICDTCRASLEQLGSYVEGMRGVGGGLNAGGT